MNNIYIIGPFGAGKTTLSKLISKKLGKELISLDSIRWSVYEKIGYDLNHVEQLVKKHKFIDLYRYNRKFESELVKKVVQNASNKVVDFGAGHSIIEDDLDFEYIRNQMKEKGTTIFLDKSYHIGVHSFHPEEVFLNNYFLASKCNQKLSDITITVDNKSKLQVLNKALSALKSMEVI
ncbi:shikimate kinase [Photorhabdus sp. RM71S]|uniref:shikimate kinase n=1 Tax=Photorhabdus sp. RM71S TaxID=3342824 RepID=UPI0036D9B107